jgi:hypothetical protein
MKVKASELQGEALDRAVAKCEGIEVRQVEGVLVDPLGLQFSPSIDWSYGGMVIERERIATWFERYEDEDAGLPCWFAAKYGEREYPGPTLLIAGMRCYVASKLGDEVEVPEK